VTSPTLLAVPNVSEGRDITLIDRLARSFDVPPARLLDVHSDPDHHRSVFTLAGPPGSLYRSVLAGAREALAQTDISRHPGLHPHVGALDVAPIVYLREEDAGAASAEALVLADLLGEELELPVFLYGALADGRTRAQLRAGGAARLAERVAAGELSPDFGPSALNPGAGAVLVASRPPLVAFNVELAPPASLETAKQIAAAIRDGGPDGLPHVRAMGIWLAQHDRAQVSMNIEDPRQVSLAEAVAAVARHASVAEAELVGLAPAAALANFPPDVPLRGARTIEDALQASD
jgi:glutamate formiminotransferase